MKQRQTVYSPRSEILDRRGESGTLKQAISLVGPNAISRDSHATVVLGFHFCIRP